ncbi:MAG: cyclic nucleotide-binding domain-containing protein [Verrucomicrobia bacterium]|nr:cyclic nucleotide-binding domain-containing protein [Verrucomicrobiota bacterium]
MIDQEKFNLLKANYLFENLPDEQLEQILSITQDITIPKGELLLREGEVGEDIYVLISGKVSVVKQEHQVASLHPGEVIGEMSLIDNSPRSASILVLEESKFLKIPLAKLPTLTQITQNISKQLTKRLRNTTESTVQALQAELEGAKLRVEMGGFLFRILLVLAGWIFASTMVIKYERVIKNSSFISIPAIFLIFLISIYQVKSSAYPRSYYGLTLDKWKKNLWEGSFFTLPLLIGGTLLKWVLVNQVPLFKNQPIFSLNFTLQSLLPPMIYVLFTPLQEFIARSVTQTCVKFSLSGKHTVFWSIILSNLIFAGFHVFLSPIFAIASFVGGLFWGWLYARQGSLVGCSVSHALIGGYFLSALGFGAIFRGQ